MAKNGYINGGIEEEASRLAEHNLIMRLFHDAGIKVLPFIPKGKVAEELKKEENIIEEVLNG